MNNKTSFSIWSRVWPFVRALFIWFIAPAVLYLLFFFIFQPHYLSGFSDAFYLDNGDGFQNVWNIWWVNESVTQMGEDPYYTTMLHHPHGTTLVPQTMNAFNGFMAIPLINTFGFNLFEAVNFAVVFSFIVGGVTMFWFIQKLYRKYWVSLVAGALFTFSAYHFAHAFGHLQLVSFEWIPLFLLAFWLMIEKLQYRYAILASVALFLVMLCDYYYLFWSVIVGASYVAWKFYKRELKITRQAVKVFLVFTVVCICLIAPLVLSLLRLNGEDKLLGSHDPSTFSLDPFSIIVPGGSWYWSSLTDWHWMRLPYLAETSVFFGIALLTVLGVAFYKTFIQKKRKQWRAKAPADLMFWWIILFAFGVMALGPHPTLFGKTAEFIALPYLALEEIFPTLKLSGMPVRWTLISLIAAIVIVSYMLSRLDMTKRKGIALGGLFIIVMFVDIFPARLPLTDIPTASYVEFLRSQPHGAVIDNAAVSEPQQLRNQTIHEKPMAFGYVTRLPESVAQKDFQIFADLEEGRYDELCSEHRVRYVTLPPSRPLKTNEFPIIYKDGQALIYDLKQAGNC